MFTQLPVDGDYGPRKSVWWSAHSREATRKQSRPSPSPRLDERASRISEGGTNAYTPEDGWFMISGIDPDEPGCWRVTATYRGATLSYVYER